MTSAKIELTIPTPMSLRTFAASPILPGQLRSLLLELRDDVVVLVEVLERLVLVDELLDVVHVPGDVAGEVLGLADQRRDQEPGEHDRNRDEDRVDRRDREGRAACAG